MGMLAALLTARWPKQPRDDKWAKAWLSAYAPFPLGDALRVVDMIDPQGGAPEGHEILRHLRDHGIEAEGLVGDVLTAIRTRGYVRPPAPGEWRSPAVGDAIEAFGGWAAVCTEHDLGDPATRAQFRDLIRARMNERRARGDVVIHPGIAPIAEQNQITAANTPLFDDPVSTGGFVPMPAAAKAAVEALDAEVGRRGVFARRRH